MVRLGYVTTIHSYLQGTNLLLRFFFLFREEVASEYVNSFSLGLAFVSF